MHMSPDPDDPSTWKKGPMFRLKYNREHVLRIENILLCPDCGGDIYVWTAAFVLEQDLVEFYYGDGWKNIPALEIPCLDCDEEHIVCPDRPEIPDSVQHVRQYGWIT